MCIRDREEEERVQMAAEEESSRPATAQVEEAQAPSPYDPAKHPISEVYGNRPPTTEQLEKERLSSSRRSRDCEASNGPRKI